MYKEIVLLSVISLVGLHIYNLITVLDIGKEVKNKGPHDCYTVPDIAFGSEDIQVISEKDAAIVSSGFLPVFPSNIYHLNLGTEGKVKPQPFQFESTFDIKDFHPHGIYVKKSQAGPYHLYVINHHTEFECIDVFEVDFESLRLVHIKRIKDPTFRNLNDLIVIDDFVFYVTNWLSSRNKLHNFIDMLLQLPSGNVVYFDGIIGDIAVGNLLIPNGIEASPDKKHIYVGLSGGKSVASYARSASGHLEFLKQYPAKFIVDNLTFLKDGDSQSLWFAGPYVGFNAMLRLFKLSDNDVPSVICRFDVKSDGSLSTVEEIFVDDGRLVSTASSVFPYKNKLLIGTVDNRMTICSFEK